MYEKFYQLSSRPFQLMPDPRLLFESRDQLKGLSYLLYGLERGEGFVVITGDVGTGKTLLLQALLGELEGRNLAVARVAMANLGADSVVPAVAAAFGLPYRDRGKLELFDALVGRLQASRAQGALLIVDEAQACSVEALEELRVLGNLQAGGQALIQIALIGQTELRDLLATPSMSHLRQRVVAAHHLQPLAVDEIRGYIEHRLQRVGWNADPEIDPDVYPRVHDWSGGVPRRINMLMDRVLLYGFLKELHHVGVVELNTVIEEFEQELGANPMIWKEGNTATFDAPRADAALGPGRLEALGERLRHMEQALRNAVGGRRMEELLTTHRVDVENRAVIEAERRLTCLEGVLTDLEAELRQGEDAPHATPEAPPSSQRTSANDVDRNRPAASRDDMEVPPRKDDLLPLSPEEDWIDDFEIRPSRLFFWRRRHRD